MARGFLDNMGDRIVDLPGGNSPSALPAMGEERKYTGLSGWLELQRLKKQGLNPDFDPYAKDWQGRPMAPPPLTDDQALGLLSKQKKVEAQQADIDHKRLLSMIESDKHGVAMAEAKKKMALEQGLMEASQKDGIVGAMDFLQSADPKEYMRLKKMQTEVERGMLENKKLSESSRLDKLGTLKEGYAIVANVGQQIENLKSAKEKAEVHQMMYPMMKEVMGNMPNIYNPKAKGMYRLALAMSDPKAIHKRAKNEQLKSSGKISKLHDDLALALSRGADPNSKRVLDIQKQIDAQNSIADKALFQQQQLKLNQGRDAMSKVQSLVKDYRKENETYIHMGSVYQKAAYIFENRAALERVGDSALVRLVARLFDKGVLSEDDVRDYKGSDPNVLRMRTMIEGYLYKSQSLSMAEKIRLVTMAKTVYAAEGKLMEQRKQRYYKLFSIGGLNQYTGQLDAAIARVHEPQNPKPNPGEVEFLKQRPDLGGKFDEKYGPGASERYLR